MWSNHVSWERSIGEMMDSERKALRVDGSESIGLTLVDRTGTIMADENEANILKYNLVTAGVDFAKPALSGTRGFIRSKDPVDHLVDVVGYAPVPDHGGFKANGWAIYCHQEASEIAAATTGLRNFGFIIVGGAVAFVLPSLFMGITTPGN